MTWPQIFMVGWLLLEFVGGLNRTLKATGTSEAWAAIIVSIAYTAIPVACLYWGGFWHA